MGSETTPPCTEKALWAVILRPIEATVEQLQFVDKMFHVKPSRHLNNTNRRPISFGFYYNTNINNSLSKKVVWNRKG